MEAVVETTVWSDSNLANHTYLLDGTKMIAYIKVGSTTPFYFKNPITIDKRGRKFQALKVNPFKKIKEKSTIIKVSGSKGNIYSIDTVDKTCTCPGYTFRGTCKHITELV
jgi:uncharacterized Zn finger protein